MFLKKVVKWVFEWPDVTKSGIYLKDIGPSGGIWRHRADWSVFNPLARRPRKHIFQTSSQRMYINRILRRIWDGIKLNLLLLKSYIFWANQCCSLSMFCNIQLNLNISFNCQFHKTAFSTCSTLRWVTHDVFTDQSDYHPNTFDFPE